MIEKEAKKEVYVEKEEDIIEEIKKDVKELWDLTRKAQEILASS